MSMRQKKGLQLKRIGSKYMIVNVVQNEVNLTDVFTLNESAAWLWQQTEGKEMIPEVLAEALCRRYEVEKETALRDVTRQLEEWKGYGLLEE